jgi:hypothetical protein
VHILAPLSYVPRLRDMLWSRGFHWGFETYQHLYVNWARFDIDLVIVESNYLSPPEAVVDEMVDFGRKLVPDALEVNQHGYHPAPFLPLGPDRPEIDPFDNEDEDAAASPSS